MCTTTTVVFTQCNHRNAPYTSDICSHYRHYSELIKGSAENPPMDPYSIYMQALIGLCRGLTTQSKNLISIQDECPACKSTSSMCKSMKEVAVTTAQAFGIQRVEGKEDPRDRSFESKQRTQHRGIAKELLRDFDHGVPMSAEKVAWLEQVLITGSSKGGEIHLAIERWTGVDVHPSQMRMPSMEGDEQGAASEGNDKGKTTEVAKGDGGAAVDKKGWAAEEGSGKGGVGGDGERKRKAVDEGNEKETATVEKRIEKAPVDRKGKGKATNDEQEKESAPLERKAKN